MARLATTVRSRMSSAYLFGAAGKGMAKKSNQPSGPIEPRGKRATGRIVKLLFGQGHGFIRLPNAREVFFHRADVQEGTRFNDLQIGDAVTFELLEDLVSGARALRIERRKRPR